MGTPLKSISAFLSPRVLYPLSPLPNLSPKLLSVTQSAKVNNKETKRIVRVNHVVKKLEFSKFADTTKQLVEPIQIKITDVCGIDNEISRREDIVINTPNKENIVKNGLEDPKHLNILGKGTFGTVIRGIHEEIDNFQHQGTVFYSAPELLSGKDPTEKSDVYSLGILLWQLRSRIPPYNDIDNIETVIYKVRGYANLHQELIL
ncbi:hypothetical protein NQ314_004111 [Rhamnusium bicolor]|uniref:Protein kinase domain-containing protein n=1 Tax=Rhamnusium bicolor TaxID=1586634 RepID=A0AAV8ZMI5_9CUCU|nr:hypothetical protein NQ314_004111 [Rhamnusium bicolor]